MLHYYLKAEAVRPYISQSTSISPKGLLKICNVLHSQTQQKAKDLDK